MIEHIHDLLFVYGNRAARPDIVPAVASEDTERPVRSVSGKIFRIEPESRIRRFFTAQGDILYFTARQRLPDARRRETASILAQAEQTDAQIARLTGSRILITHPDEHIIATIDLQRGMASPFAQKINGHYALPSRIHLVQSIPDGAFRSHNTGVAPIPETLLETVTRLLERGDMTVAKPRTQ